MTAPDDDNIFTVVSRPGPAERRILDELAPTFASHRRVGAGVSLRTLEGGEGSPVVLLHGRGHGAAIWAPLALRLAKSHRVLAIDLPGFGHSAAPPFHGSRPEEGLAFFVEPVEAFLSSLSPREPVTLVGHSLGGLVATAITLGGKVPVRALGLVDAMGMGPEVSTRSRLYLRANPERLARFRASSFLKKSAANDLEALREELLTVRGGRPRATRAFDTMVPLTGPGFHLRERLSSIDVPTLLLWGQNDEAFPLSVAEEARALIRTSRLVTLPTGHSPHLEATDATNDAIAGWLSDLER